MTEHISHQNMQVYMKSMDIVILRILLIMVMEQTDCMLKKYNNKYYTYYVLKIALSDMNIG